MTTHSPSPQAASATARELDRATDTTAQLSFAVYLDRELRDAILDDILDRTDRALAPSPGVDVGLIVRHARQARAIIAIRMAALAFLAVCFYASPQMQSLVVTAALVAWLFVACLMQLTLAKTSVFFEHYSVGHLLANGPMLLLMGVVGAILVILVVLRALESRVAWAPLIGSVLALGVVGSLAHGCKAWRMITILERRDPPSLASARVGEFERVQHSEVITHRARERFTGFGIPVLQLSTKLRLTAPGDKARPDQVELEELVKHIRVGIEGFTVASGNSSCPGRLEFSEPVFVADRVVKRPVYHLADPRLPGGPFEAVAEVRADPSLVAQPMLRMQVVRRNGELVTNLFAKCVIEADTLWLDFYGYCLPPTRPEYDQFSEGKTPILTWSVVNGFVNPPLELLQIPVSLARTARHQAARLSRPLTRRMSLSTGNCGPTISIREHGTDLKQSHPEEEKESERIAAILAHRCMEAVKDYLRDKVDVTGLEDHMGRVATEFKIETIMIGVLGNNAQAAIGAIGAESRGTTHAAPDLGSAGEPPDALDDAGEDR